MLTALALIALAQSPTVSVVFGGDVIPHEPVKYVAREHARGEAAGDGWDQVFGPLAPVFRRNDFALVNLESPVLTTERPEHGEMVFNAPPEMLTGLVRAGVTIASFANNHCLDQHREGIASTRALLFEAGLLGVGADVTEAAAWRPLIVEKNGVTLGFLSVTRWLNGFQNTKDPLAPHVPTIPYPREAIIGGRTPDEVRALVKEAAGSVDALIIFIHWGLEYSPVPTADDRKLAALLLEAGAFAVVGHHPHVLQPVEWVTRADGSRGLVAYSLGNLVSNQDAANAAGATRDGLLLELVIEKSAHGAQLKSAAGVPIATENRQGRGRTRNVQPVLLDDEILAMTERLDVVRARSDLASRAELKTLQRRLDIARARRARIEALLGPAAPVRQTAER